MKPMKRLIVGDGDFEIVDQAARTGLNKKANSSDLAAIENEIADVKTRLQGMQPIYTIEPTDVIPGTMAFVNGKPQWYDGTKWVDATGATVI